MNTKLPQAYGFLVCGLPNEPGLLLERDLSEEYGVDREGVASWWRLALIAYAGNPTPEVARWILTGEG